MKLKSTLIVVVLLSAVCTPKAQHSYWLSFMENLDLDFNDLPSFALYVSTDVDANLSLEVPSTGLVLPFTAQGGTVTEYRLPDAIWYSEGTDQIDNKGIKINADVPVQITAFHYRGFFSESTNVLEEQELGTDYWVIASDDQDNRDPSSFVIVSTSDNNEIEITPSVITNGLRPPGIPYTIQLQQGQNYQVQAQGDLTGTRIRSINGNRIAVFSGAKQANIGNCSADSHVYDQLLPSENWGTSYFCVPFLNQGGDVLKVIAKEDSTAIFIGCNPLPLLNAGESISFRLETPTLINANKKIGISQFNEGGDCNPSGLGDPNMLQLSPIEYQISNQRFFSDGRINPNYNARYFTKHFVNIITPADNVQNISVDGNSNLPFSTLPDDPSYAYLQLEVSAGNHIVESSSGTFQAYSYGFGSYDAYTHQLSSDQIVPNDVTDCLIIDTEGLLCKDSLLSFSYQTSFNPVEWLWEFEEGQTSTAAFPVYTFSEDGIKRIQLILTDTLGNTIQDSIDLNILNCSDDPCNGRTPDLSLAFSGSNCPQSTVSFSLNSEQSFTAFEWDLGNGQTSSNPTPAATYDAPGTYEIEVSVSDSLNCTFTQVFSFEVFDCVSCEEVGDLSISFNTPICLDSTISLSVPLNPNAQPLIEVSWLVNGEIASTNLVAEIEFPQVGNYEIQFFAKDVFGCDYFGIAFLEVVDCTAEGCIAPAPLEIDIDNTPCQGRTSSFSLNTPASLVSFNWTTNLGSESFGPSFSVNPGNSEFLEVTFSGTDVNGCDYFEQVAFDLGTCEGEDCVDLPALTIVPFGTFEPGNQIIFTILNAEDFEDITWVTNNGVILRADTLILDLEEAFTLFVQVEATEISSGCTRIGTAEYLITLPDPCATLPDLEIIGEENIDCFGSKSYQLQTEADILSINWRLNDDFIGMDTSLELNVREEGTYTLSVESITEEGCSITDSLAITVANCSCIIDFPNAFTPNNDNINDVFSPVYTEGCPFRTFNMKVFSRWGELIFESNNIENGWDGTYRGQALPSDVYVYLINYAFENTSLDEVASGDILLIR